MTASELIEKLKEYPPETVVAVHSYETWDDGDNGRDNFRGIGELSMERPDQYAHIEDDEIARDKDVLCL